MITEQQVKDAEKRIASAERIISEDRKLIADYNKQKQQERFSRVKCFLIEQEIVRDTDKVFVEGLNVHCDNIVYENGTHHRDIKVTIEARVYKTGNYE
jgi:hypothetical protein